MEKIDDEQKSILASIRYKTSCNNYFHIEYHQKSSISHCEFQLYLITRYCTKLFHNVQSNPNEDWWYYFFFPGSWFSEGIALSKLPSRIDFAIPLRSASLTSNSSSPFSSITHTLESTTAHRIPSATWQNVLSNIL